ncbi:MAG: methylated-DNA--[protein]-cysteine S-methyltransferase [Streptomyces sp.]
MTEPPASSAARTPTRARSCTWTLQDTGLPGGPLLLAATDQGLVNVVFHAGGQTTDRALAQLTARLGSAPVHTDAAGTDVLSTATAELASYFRGELRTFTVPLDWSLSGGFNERVLRELFASVPFGTNVGYQDLAERVGEPGAARAVGMAMGSNPLPVVVPCHRVVESGGGLGGFGGGTETKRALLALEGLLPEPLF